MNYNNKKFRAISNTENGETSENTVFNYFQTNNILTGNYSGGKIVCGQLIGIVEKNGNIDMRYQQINDNGQITTGICQSKPSLLPDGRIRLTENWQWTSGDCSKGYSIIEEII